MLEPRLVQHGDYSVVKPDGENGERPAKAAKHLANLFVQQVRFT